MELTAFFAYGTLKRGFCREKCWPKPPERVQKAWIQGQLFDLGPYPGLAEGLDWIEGELWVIHPGDMAETIETLDIVEGHSGDISGDLYLRKPVEVLMEDGSQSLAYTYYFNQWRSTAAQRIEPTIPFLFSKDDAQSSQQLFCVSWRKDGPSSEIG